MRPALRPSEYAAAIKDPGRIARVHEPTIRADHIAWQDRRAAADRPTDDAIQNKNADHGRPENHDNRETHRKTAPKHACFIWGRSKQTSETVL